MGRAGLVGDEIGSALIGARLVQDVMRLCFLMERTYAPYPKWFGTAFARLSCAPPIMPTLRSALTAHSWQEREKHVSLAYEHIAHMHNTLGLTRPFPERVIPFHGRPFEVMAMQGFADALLSQITDPAVKAISEQPPIGGLGSYRSLFGGLPDLYR